VCRHLAYLGPPLRLGRLLTEAPHSLIEQARRPRFQTSGTANPDGWGIAWYEAGAAAPRHHRSAAPIWADPVRDEVAATQAAGPVVAAVRLASPGSPVDVSGTAPFVADRYAWSLNGVVDGWHDGVGDELRRLVSRRRAAGIAGVTDAEALFALALDALDDGAPPLDAVASVVATLGARATGRLNVLLTDGVDVVATAWGNSLFARAANGSTLLASEPLDADPGWARVDDRTLLHATAAGLEHPVRL